MVLLSLSSGRLGVTDGPATRNDGYCRIGWSCRNAFLNAGFILDLRYSFHL